MLCGEAAGFMRFFTEGITTALITGEKAGECILESIKKGDNPVEHYLKATLSERKFILAQHKQYSQIPGLSSRSLI